jgi:chorismate mutase
MLVNEPHAGEVDRPEMIDDTVSLDLLQVQLERLEHELVDLVRRRTLLARQLSETRRRLGGTSTVHDLELAVVRRFRCLGSSGRDMAMILLRLGRPR